MAQGPWPDFRSPVLKANAVEFERRSRKGRHRLPLAFQDYFGKQTRAQSVTGPTEPSHGREEQGCRLRDAC